MWTNLQNISEISLTVKLPRLGWNSSLLQDTDAWKRLKKWTVDALGPNQSDWMCKTKMLYFVFHMIVCRSDSHSGHKHSLGNKKHMAHIFTPVGKYLDCRVQGPWCFCPSDRIIAERELTPAAAHSRERAQLCIWSCQSSTHKSIYTSVGSDFSWPLRHHLLTFCVMR